VISAMSGITHLVKVFQKCSQIPRFHGCIISVLWVVVRLLLLYYNLT